MKSASEFDVQCAVNGWYGNLSNVMFSVAHPWHGWLLAHIKDHVEINHHYMLAMETHDGCPIIVEYEWLRAIPKREGTPAKHKRVCKKGTKPWLSKFEYADYDPKIIAPGVRVKCRDKKIRTIEYIRSDHIHFVECHNLVDTKSGLGNYISKTPFFCDIMKIIIEKKIDKPAHDRYNGYTPNVWHFWQGNTDVPPVSDEVIIKLWLRNEVVGCTAIFPASFYLWQWDSVHPESDIIAFKITGEF